MGEYPAIPWDAVESESEPDANYEKHLVAMEGGCVMSWVDDASTEEVCAGAVWLP